MDNTKIIPSGCFYGGEMHRPDAQDEMDILAHYAREGWVLHQFTEMGYQLKREEPSQLSYMYDLCEVDRSDFYSYTENFEKHGWRYVSSCGSGCHFFTAPWGTEKPVFAQIRKQGYLSEKQPVRNKSAAQVIKEEERVRKALPRRPLMARPGFWPMVAAFGSAAALFVLTFLFASFAVDVGRMACLAAGVLALIVGGTYAIGIFGDRAGASREPLLVSQDELTDKKED